MRGTGSPARRSFASEAAWAGFWGPTTLFGEVMLSFSDGDHESSIADIAPRLPAQRGNVSLSSLQVPSAILHVAERGSRPVSRPSQPNAPLGSTTGKRASGATKASACCGGLRASEEDSRAATRSRSSSSASWCSHSSATPCVSVDKPWPVGCRWHANFRTMQRGGPDFRPPIGGASPCVSRSAVRPPESGLPSAKRWVR